MLNHKRLIGIIDYVILFKNHLSNEVLRDRITKNI